MAKVNYLDKGISAMQPMINATHTTDTDKVGVVLYEEKCLGYVNLRIKPTPTNKKLVKEVLAVTLPQINRINSDKQLSVLGLGPTEWLIMIPNGKETETADKLSKALASKHHLVADVTGGTTKLNITGEGAQDLLEKGTYVDLHDSVFKKGQLYATQIAHAPAIIVKNGSNDFSLIVRRSFSHHIANWAVDAATEYGFSFT